MRLGMREQPRPFILRTLCADPASRYYTCLELGPSGQVHGDA